jgi:Carboxylesterase family
MRTTDLLEQRDAEIFRHLIQSTETPGGGYSDAELKTITTSWHAAARRLPPMRSQSSSRSGSAERGLPLEPIARPPATYADLFTWESPGWDGKRGASHEVNTPFVFGNYDIPEARGFVPSSPEVEQLSHRMQDAWIAFARTGSPRTTHLPDWEPYTAQRRSTMLLGTSCHTVDAPYETERRFWADART